MHAIASGAREFSLGAYDEALARFAEVDAVFRVQALEPGLALYQGDLVEALVATGELIEAAEQVENLEQRASELGRDYALAEAARGRALILAANSDLDGSAAQLERSLGYLDRLDAAPYARARTLLTLGMVLRRAKKRAAARAALGEAADVFARLGAEVWLARTRDEAARISGRAASGPELTETERRVAELVASGRSNKEVASELFVTVRTVEANLTRIYGKLGVRSRTALARRLSA
jgi:DNA-binding CsgD family transcriptional regulator